MGEKDTLCFDVLTGKIKVEQLDDQELLRLLSMLESVFVGRVMNCIDASGKSDAEWLALSSIFGRIRQDMEQRGKVK